MLPPPISFLEGYVRGYGDAVLRLDNRFKVVQIYGTMGFPKAELIGKEIDTFIIYPNDARNFKLNLERVRIFGGSRSMNIPLYYKKNVVDYYFRIDRYGQDGAIVIRSKRLGPERKIT